MSGIATARLAVPDATELAVVGTGEQALPQVAAIARVRRLRQVRVFSPDAPRRAAFAERVESELGVPAQATASVAQAVAGAPIATLVTRATKPFLSSDMVGHGTHINAVGAIVPARAEFEPGLLDRCAVVAVDSLPQVQALSWEFREHYGAGGRGWGAVQPLAALLAGGSVRPPDADLTLFKSMGTGLADLAVGARCYQRALAQGQGRELQQPARVPLRYRAGQTVLGG